MVLAAFSMLPLNVKADSSEVKVLTYSSYIAPKNTTLAAEAGDYVVVGEIQNIGANIISTVNITGTVSDESGNQLASANTQAFVYHMLPNQKAPFHLCFTTESNSTDNTNWIPSVSKVSIAVTSVINTPDKQYSGLTIPNPPGVSQFPTGNGLYILMGTIVNTGNQVAQDPWVTATFYNSSGYVVGLAFTPYLIDSLSQGMPERFIITPTDDTPTMTNQITNYTVTIDSLTLENTTLQTTASPKRKHQHLNAVSNVTSNNCGSSHISCRSSFCAGEKTANRSLAASATSASTNRLKNRQIIGLLAASHFCCYIVRRGEAVFLCKLQSRLSTRLLSMCSSNVWSRCESPGP